MSTATIAAAAATFFMNDSEILRTRGMGHVVCHVLHDSLDSVEEKALASRVALQRLRALDLLDNKTVQGLIFTSSEISFECFMHCITEGSENDIVLCDRLAYWFNVNNAITEIIVIE